ncbi:hypothetical protein QVD17_00058 [Tagetes erecta]|uniref:Uncharacterized protein n=1 Tax=Tagetes erecta TaxID=13708 RepID=A0AAD8LAW2_TARER|nr:hypothetical protein QVD17_00058 [Tagetes erecta]
MESKLLASFNEASLDEERFLKQKAKVHWLAEGDANTKYFHNTLKCRNHRARIDVITDSNGSLHEGKAVPKAFVDHYVGFLGKEDISIIPVTPELFDVRIDQAVAVDMIRENSILNIMPFVEGKLPVRYLGVPLVASRVRTSDCWALIEKVDNRIGDWKNKLLSFAVLLLLVFFVHIHGAYPMFELVWYSAMLLILMVDVNI